MPVPGAGLPSRGTARWYRKRRRRHRAGVCQTLDGGAVRRLGTSSDRIGDVHDVVAVFQGLDGREREADLRVEAADDQARTLGRLHRFAERLVLERVHRIPVDRLDAVELGHDRGKRRTVEAGPDAHGREYDRQAEGHGSLGQQADLYFDEVGARLRAVTSNISFW